ncbi:hypothetical protein TNIN_381851 [Trichonephila inaurata madagascariensis]|uniref:Uncharacterized protein n=1 Tax=Trichonephila inaurata madagascariensis TaxID=2747483 RepID=A0A8X6YF44_9ARAC|nr:hypothetical protein TNIN_381851 [Trichonephila inaurata madagascariensis]
MGTFCRQWYNGFPLLTRFAKWKRPLLVTMTMLTGSETQKQRRYGLLRVCCGGGQKGTVGMGGYVYWRRRWSCVLLKRVNGNTLVALVKST